MAYDPRWTESKHKHEKHNFRDRLNDLVNKILNHPLYNETLGDPEYKETDDINCGFFFKEILSLHDFPTITEFSRFLEDLYNLQVKSKQKPFTVDPEIIKNNNMISLTANFTVDDNLIDNLEKIVSLLVSHYNVSLDTIFKNGNAEPLNFWLDSSPAELDIQHMLYRLKKISNDYISISISNHRRISSSTDSGTEKKKLSLDRIEYTNIYAKLVILRQSHLEKITGKNVASLFKDGCFLYLPDGNQYNWRKPQSFRLEVCGPTKKAVATTGNLLNAILGYTTDEYKSLLTRLPISMDVIQSKITPHIASEEIKIHPSYELEVLNLPDFIRKIDFLYDLSQLKRVWLHKDYDTDDAFGFRNKTSRKRKSRKNRNKRKSKKTSRKSKNSRNSKKSKHSRNSRKNKKSNKLRKRNRKSRK